ncbi:RbsD/FucU family protein [Ornithinimicrobium sediminis]|uniref:RbsD/FucU family protein n=1 Tax=Ornithinimicrobium sediminis TaxID=2904603 RepID=UPI001E52E046|nr:RbsD/FucU domain-containing protein [Ornithinimicrobium sediminis]MCE0487383.1 transport protein RbsD/FucU [Ornithinimicrobium sediminis]
MLKNIDPLLTGSLLRLLDEMGHGDVLGLVDRNFPAYRYRVPVVDLRGADTAAAVAALLSVFPLDRFVAAPLRRMEIDGEPERVTESTAALERAAAEAEGEEITMEPVERFDFYRQAEGATAFVQTGDTVPYSCYLLQKGVV